MLEGVASVLPLLLLTAIGFACARQPWFGRPGMDFLSKFNLEVCIPVYMFYSVTRTYTEPRQLLELLYNTQYPLIIILIGFAVGYAMCAVLGIRSPQRGVFINAVSLSNIVVMGLPVTVSLFGDGVLPYVMVYYAIGSFAYWTLGVWLLRQDAGGHEGIGVLKALKMVFLSRPLVGLMAGMLWVCLEIPMAQPVNRLMAMLGATVTPLSMVFIGCVIRHANLRKVGHFRELGLVVGYRFLAVPVITGILCTLFPIDPTMKKVIFLLANMPSMAQLPLMAKEVGSDYELASAATVVTTTIGMAAVPIYVFLIGYFSLFT